MQIEIVIALGACLALLLISVVYFKTAKALPPRLRIFVSAHAALIAMILPYGLFIDASYPGNPPPIAQLPILLFLILGAMSMVFSVWKLRDRWVLHLVHLFTIVAAIPIGFLGLVSVVGWT